MTRTASLLPVVLAALVAIGTPRDAWAYLDPGTGSYVLQLAAAGLLASMFTLKLYWQRVKDWYRGVKPESPPTGAPGAQPRLPGEHAPNTDERR